MISALWMNFICRSISLSCSWEFPTCMFKRSPKHADHIQCHGIHGSRTSSRGKSSLFFIHSHLGLRYQTPSIYNCTAVHIWLWENTYRNLASLVSRTLGSNLQKCTNIRGKEFGRYQAIFWSRIFPAGLCYQVFEIAVASLQVTMVTSQVHFCPVPRKLMSHQVKEDWTRSLEGDIYASIHA